MPMRAVLIALSLVLVPATASAMSMSFSWGPTKKCLDTKSPPIVLSDVPSGTKTLKFKMVDLNYLSFNHGGGTVRYSGRNELPYGAFRYKGPCPPSMHYYQMTVDAFDANGKKLATAKARQSYQK
ncbi:hypothetical protein DFR52_101905 [Hoeflea marina]|uniref:Phospholipid-binding protein n=1 Tax=Hoeflea marina TaxID=274592 RepID=A0A317PRW2_9HYPH|nr:phospholipid-binding protein [Hoeflea marina]PWW04213.1 hypothetical protein DFR52_101905 [Hoeflea marina]